MNQSLRNPTALMRQRRRPTKIHNSLQSSGYLVKESPKSNHFRRILISRHRQRCISRYHKPSLSIKSYVYPQSQEPQRAADDDADVECLEKTSARPMYKIPHELCTLTAVLAALVVIDPYSRVDSCRPAKSSNSTLSPAYYIFAQPLANNSARKSP